MLLEDEPRPLGDDVSVQIPPVDEGKFVNRLTGAAPEGKSAAKMAASRDAKAPQAEREAKSPQPDDASKSPSRAEGDGDPASQPAPPAAMATPAAPLPSAGPGATGAASAKKSLTDAEQRMLALATKPEPRAEPRPGTAETTQEAEPKSAAEGKAVAMSTAKAASAPQAGEFVVQLAAFADDKGANALANKLKRAGYAAYVEPVTTSRGTLWRVRVGGYTSRSEADAARAKLKEEGYSGIVASAQ
jgi:DedD protein